MKITSLASTIILLLMIVSCSSERTFSKRKYLGPFKTKKVRYQQAESNNNLTDDQFTSLTDTITRVESLPVKKIPNVLTSDGSPLPLHKEEIEVSQDHNEEHVSEVNEEPCSEIIFRDGTSVKAEVILIGVKDVTYKRCDVPNGPEYQISKSEIFMIRYPDGSKDVFEEEKNKKSSNNKSINYNAVIITLMALTVILAPFISVFMLLFAIANLIVSSVALSKLNKDPDTRVHRGLAIAGILVSAAALLAVIGFIVYVFAWLL